MHVRAIAGLIALSALTAGCGEEGPNLPEGWEEAELIRELEQSECAGDPGEVTPELQTQILTSSLLIDMTGIPFRCDQPVEAWLRRQGVTDTIILQPVEMTPETVARCDCAYDFSLRYNPAPDVSTVELNVRADEYGGPASPQRIGTINIQQGG